MNYDYSQSLNPQKALIWRIVHRDNIPWILEHGLHCSNGSQLAANWVPIGNPELIEKRSKHPVPVGMGGYLNDYVPFYFTPFSPMMKNIHSGYGGITQRPNDEIIILVTSLHQINQRGIPFVFTDAHAYLALTNFYTDLSLLQEIDWPILQARNFKRDTNDPAKFERYQAEALIYKHCPIEALIGMVCYTESTKNQLQSWVKAQNRILPVYVKPRWYF